ncbi:DNA recombination protein RmuC [Candidatus Falkowbacteria bacterium HGW-Falkowbacteria-1]|jgi:DNA recombination protein RmuC|uniref:DNA recombination protein RmuC n=1 Tax=Candidatus Falkowbacteria bacterium HGW-Falkowbacteria-1 TaxID=2013768 RepID=A0A2N2E9Y6_9BACT|nr:MAG: DNA recombination protein RmuC [Candidatus Falkowbacteria bacterium HGW-Falkowbacteria-1]
MLNFSIIFLLILLVLLMAGLIYLFFKNSANKDSDDKLLVLFEKISELSRQNDSLRQELDRKLSETNRVSQESMSKSAQMVQGITGQSAKLISQITEKLTKLDETNKQVIGFSEQLNNLEKVLTNQKKRGNLGEAGLKLVLENILPPTAYKLQYPFEDGGIVDAVIITKDGLIPVDAKFSLDNYNRIVNEDNSDRKLVLEKEFRNDLKKRIDETSKYIKVKEGTMNFALMFIPAEAIYYDLLINEVGAVKVNTRSLIDYAYNERKVIIVSPTTFAAYLQTILQGLRAMQIEEGAKNIRKNVESLGRHLLSYEDFMKKLGGSMSTSVNHYNSAYKEFKKIDKDIARIGDGKSEVEVLEIDRPGVE